MRHWRSYQLRNLVPNLDILKINRSFTHRTFSSAHLFGALIHAQRSFHEPSEPLARPDWYNWPPESGYPVRTHLCPGAISHPRRALHLSEHHRDRLGPGTRTLLRHAKYA